MTVSSTFVLPCRSDRAILAIQDTVSQLGWNVLEISMTRVVVETPGVTKLQLANFPRLTAELREVGETTQVRVSVGMTAWGSFGAKKPLSGFMGRFVNDVSLRVQTQSLAINPTVAVGEGQGEAPQPASPAQPHDRVTRLVALKDLRDGGALTEDEFQIEKARVLNEG